MSFRKGQGQRRFLERSNEVMEFSINNARSKLQKVKVKPVIPRNMSSCMSLFGIVLHAVQVMFTCCTSEPVQTGSNRFEPVLIRLPEGAVGARSKVKGHRLMQLSVRVRVSNPNYVVCSEP